MISRRSTLKAIGVGTLATGFGASLGSLSFAQSQQNPLRIPPQSLGTLSENTRQFQLNLQRGSSIFLPNLVTETIGINGNYLGPTLRFKRNEDVSLLVNNQLGEPSTLHWHGFHLPSSQDGGPHQTIEAGATWNARFSVVQFAGIFWYHSHMFHKSGEQVYRGLAGMIIVEDDGQEAELPSSYGVDDIPLVIQDRRFNEDGSMSYMNRYEDTVMGMHGETLLVNGTYNPLLSVTAGLVRFRIINGSNARSYALAFDDEREFLQIGCDGGLLERPVSLGRLELTPGERAEILVRFKPSEQLKLVSVGRPPSFPQFPGGMSSMMRSLNAQDFDILTIRSAADLSNSLPVPEQLGSIYRLSEAAATNVRRFVLSMGAGMRSGGDRGPGTGMRTGLGGGYGGGNFAINGRQMAMDFINERIELNTTEIWEIENTSPMMHPFHVHNGQFQLLDRNGRPPAANEMGWKDTVRVESGERLRIIMRFTDFTDEQNPYMYHCHILEHEDRGMMGQFLVV